jgi:hypothetical protein
MMDRRALLAGSLALLTVPRLARRSKRGGSTDLGCSVRPRPSLQGRMTGDGISSRFCVN